MSKKLVYFDNASTSFPKPESVYLETDKFFRTGAVNPGRGTYELAIQCSEMVLDCRMEIARLFHFKHPDNVIFCFNATDALNLAIKGFVKPGDHVIATSNEHNSVLRPLNALKKQQVKTTFVSNDHNGVVDLGQLESSITPKTSLIVTNHASNVTGVIQPIREIGNIAKRYNLAFLVDAAQTAGKVDIDMTACQIDMLAFAGHKGTFGPTGTGALLISPKVQLNTLKEGGTGGKSQLEIQPLNLPEKFEAGTLNVVGIVGLREGIRFIRKEGIHKVFDHEDKLVQKLIRGLREIPKVRFAGYPDNPNRVSVISFNIEGNIALVTNQVMAERYGIAARSGLHCAPIIHQVVQSFPSGAVRLSPGYFNTQEEVDFVLASVAEIARTQFTAEEIQYIMECGAL